MAMFDLTWERWVADFLTQFRDHGKTLTFLYLRLSDKVEQQLIISPEASTAATLKEGSRFRS